MLDISVILLDGKFDLSSTKMCVPKASQKLSYKAKGYKTDFISPGEIVLVGHTRTEISAKCLSTEFLHKAGGKT